MARNDYDGPSYKQRLLMYEPLLSADKTQLEIAPETGIPIGTIKADLFIKRGGVRKPRTRTKKGENELSMQVRPESKDDRTDADYQA